MDQSTTVPATSPSGRSSRMRTLLLGVLSGMVTLGCSSNAEQQAASDALKALGAVVVNNADGMPSSLVLATGKDLDLDKALELAAKLSQLDSIILSNTKVTDEQLKYVAQISSLGDLQLNDTQITDAGIKTIANLHNLNSLYVSGSKVTSACLPDIGKLKKLQVLGIADTAISGGFESLAGLKEMTLLVAGKLKISEADAEAIIKIPGLLRIDLTDAEVSETARKILKSKIREVAPAAS